MKITKQEQTIIEEALYELLYNVKKEEEQIKKIQDHNLQETLKIYNYDSKTVKELIWKIQRKNYFNLEKIKEVIK